MTSSYIPRMKTHYQDVVIKNLNEQFNYTNAMQVPKLDKIVINMGLGDAVSDSKKADIAIDALGLIAGQKPVFTKAKKSIANFKLREGMVIGTKVTPVSYTHLTLPTSDLV
mgnify:CR=1 FL=1